MKKDQKISIYGLIGLIIGLIGLFNIDSQTNELLWNGLFWCGMSILGITTSINQWNAQDKVVIGISYWKIIVRGLAFILLGLAMLGGGILALIVSLIYYQHKNPVLSVLSIIGNILFFFAVGITILKFAINIIKNRKIAQSSFDESEVFEVTEEKPLAPTELEIPLSRKYIRMGSKVWMLFSAYFIIAGLAGAFFMLWLSHMDMNMIWMFIIIPGICILIAGIFGNTAYNWNRWAKNGPDMWLRITPTRFEIPQDDIHIEKYCLKWPEIKKWWLVIFTNDQRSFQLQTISGTKLVLNPMAYLQEEIEADIEKSIKDANALSYKIEALLKLYIGNRQGKIKKE